MNRTTPISPVGASSTSYGWAAPEGAPKGVQETAYSRTDLQKNVPEPHRENDGDHKTHLDRLQPKRPLPEKSLEELFEECLGHCLFYSVTGAAQ